MLFVMFCCNMVGITQYRFASYVLLKDSNNGPVVVEVNWRNNFRENNKFIKFA